MNGIETINLLSPHCAYCQRCKQFEQTMKTLTNRIKPI
jgi:hypothetical protein